MRHYVLAVVLLFLHAIAAPTATGQADVPVLTGRVVDTAGILSPETERALVSMLEEHESAGTNQVVILTVSELGGEAIEPFALRVARAWGLGGEERDNGVLLVVAEAEREIRIEVGYGLEGDLPDITAAQIIRREIVPRFRAGSYDDGVLAGTTAILQAIEGSYSVDESQSDEIPAAVRIIFGLLFLMMPAGFAFLALMQTGFLRWFLFVFLLPFFFAVGFLLFLSGEGATILTVLYALLFVILARSPRVARLGEKMREAARKAAAAAAVSGSSSSWRTDSGSSWSSGGGSSWSSGGGGFSGGGGSFGGGGASGSW